MAVFLIPPLQFSAKHGFSEDMKKKYFSPNSYWNILKEIKTRSVKS